MTEAMLQFIMGLAFIAVPVAGAITALAEVTHKGRGW